MISRLVEAGSGNVLIDYWICVCSSGTDGVERWEFGNFTWDSNNTILTTLLLRTAALNYD